MLRLRQSLSPKVLLLLWTFVIMLLFLLVVIFFKLNLTGNAIFSLPEAIPGKVLSGTFELDPHEAGMIPANSIVAVSYGGVLKTLPLSRLLSKEYFAQYSHGGMVFTPAIEITLEFVPSDYYNTLPVGGGGVSQDGTTIPTQEGDPAQTDSRKGTVHGSAVSGSDRSFFQTVILRYGSSANIAAHSGYEPVLASAKLRDGEIDKKYVQLSKNSQGLVLSTSYYESLTGISSDSPTALIDLKAFNFAAGQSGPITLSIVYLGQTLFSASADANIKNVPIATFQSERVFVSPRDLPTEVTVDGELAPNTIAVGPIITPDLMAAGCRSYVCDIPAGTGCSIPPLDTLNKGVLVPVEKINCNYNDCGVSFQVTQSCKVVTQDVSVVKASSGDLGIATTSSGNSESGGGSSVAVLKSDTREPVATVTTHEGSSKVDITFLQSPPVLGDHCKNGVKDADEEKVDCDGSCNSCSQTGHSYYLIFVWIAVAILGILLVVSIYRED